MIQFSFMTPTITALGSLASAMVITKAGPLHCHFLVPFTIPYSQSKLMKKLLDLNMREGINRC